MMRETVSYMFAWSENHLRKPQTLGYYVFYFTLLFSATLLTDYFGFLVLWWFTVVAVNVGLVVWTLTGTFALAWNYFVFGVTPPAIIAVLAYIDSVGPYVFIPLLFLGCIYGMSIEKTLKEN